MVGRKQSKFSPLHREQRRRFIFVLSGAEMWFPHLTPSYLPKVLRQWRKEEEEKVLTGQG
jgi:hypothetical protein